ncbi:MAG: acyl-CoA dehydrogenase [Actinobacteria bacterium]|nr:acyl-CoA dehydrogenase [Actinomycetota bacterium]
MDRYDPPLDDIRRALRAAGLHDVVEAGVDADTVDELLAEFGRVAADVIAPTDRVGDVQGSRLDPATGTVVVPDGFDRAYAAYVDGGWAGLTAPVEHGGGGLPKLVGVAVQEMLTSANMALSLNPMLTHGAVELLSARGDERQKRLYLEKLVSGRWAGTMVLTEPDAGSDVGALRTRAERDTHGDWRVNGTKIFITWGEHELTDNIVHLVLARTPGAPPGTKGISLFLVPKVLPDTGTGNGVRCVKLEEKLGIHASPTCVMEFDDAVGELVGDEGDGMRNMFVMMNAARLAVGVEGLAVAERAYQQARRYATERRQGRALGAPCGTPSPIVEHPDVRRMLLTMRSSVAAMRHVLYATAAWTDTGDRELADLLTPVAKGWSTEVGFQMASVAVQVHGGMGYIEETGVAQRLRDSRIAPIYEGTNGIQAIDLVTRKVPMAGGAVVGRVLAGIEDTVRQLEKVDDAGEADALAGAADTLRRASEWVLARGAEEPADVLAGATAYLELTGIVVGGWLLARAALGDEDSMGLWRFYATETLPRAAGLLTPVTAGAARLTAAL